MFGAVAVEAPAASATPASFIAGKLASGAGEAVMGKLMAQAGLDPTANALSEISAQLTQLSNQIKELKGTSDKTLREVLDASFAGRYDQLEISTITKFEEDYVCYLDPRKALATRETCRTRFKRQAPSAQLGTATDKFSDLLMNPKTTIVEAYAKSLVGTRPFYTVEDQKKVTDFFTYLEDMEVMATTLSVEAENVIAAGEGPEAVKEVWEVAKLEAETLSRRRASQLARNPVAPIPGPLDTVQKLWLNPSVRGFRDYWSAAQVNGTWRLPTGPELLAMVKDRGDRTVRKYLIDEAGMGTTFANVPETGESGEFWTSTEYPCLWTFGATCHLTVSTNNAYVRAKPTAHGSTEPKYYSFQVAELSAHDQSRYGFLLK
ncbi:MAG TPA: hypothetical protein VHS74_07150 [Solirubrobacterales bacterium]|nr:hypothetical protein [Solirubrobacterales bacterium]